MRFLADMGISQSTVDWLREKGYDAIHLREEDLHRTSDMEIVEKGDLKSTQQLVVSVQLRES